MQKPNNKQYPLQIAISSLFIIVILVLGSVLTLKNYQQSSDMMLVKAHDEYQHIAHQLALDIKANYPPVITSIRLLNLSPLVFSSNSQERLKYVKLLKTTLIAHPAVLAVRIGYPDGDAFNALLLNTDDLRQTFHAPNKASLLVIMKEHTIGRDSEAIFVFFDEQLNEISRKSQTTQFDHRQSSWFQQADSIPNTTRPYIIYGTDIVSFAAMQKSESGAVVGVNITLDTLSQTISRHKITPHSEVVLINSNGQVFAYSDINKLQKKKPTVTGTNDTAAKALKLLNLSNMKSDVLAFFGKNLEVKEESLDFEYQGEKWIGSSHVVGKIGNEKIYAVMLSPVKELLTEVITMQRNSLLTTLIILLISLPIILWISKRISSPLHFLSSEAQKISRFEFDEKDSSNSFIKEVDELDSAMEMMKSTINKFIKLINSLAGEQDLDALLKSITRETMLVSHSDAALIYLMDEKEDYLNPSFLCQSGDNDKETKYYNLEQLSNISLEEVQLFVSKINNGDSRVIQLNKESDNKLSDLLTVLNKDDLTTIILPLNNRDNDIIGLLCLVYYRADSSIIIANQKNIDFVEALSGFAAVTLESKQLINIQEALLNAFIKLIAGAIDAKSPYTGGHCQRVPEITLMLAKAACESNDDKYKDYDLSEQQWEELSIAGWLHDCGKVTTPEFVVDKSTKLETLYDRIHEVRMRFEVLKRDADIDYWQKLHDGGDEHVLATARDKTRQQLDDDFAFIAECNIGGEFMADEKLQRLNQIAQYTWLRTIDDSLGLSWEENNRKNPQSNHSLPVTEKLLNDKPEHLIERQKADCIAEDNPLGFKVDTPEYKYNRGELYNLSVKRGTLNDEERYMINGHMIQTIMMLENLPFPKHLRNVPIIAGSHHETMDGKGYPRRLSMSEHSLSARMMVIADIFEALTASDRPYKKAKSLSESIRILSFFKKDNHIDPDLFDLFLTSGVYLEYAHKYLNPEQIDPVDINQYLSTE